MCCCAHCVFVLRGRYKIDIVQSSSEYLPQALKSAGNLSLNLVPSINGLVTDGNTKLCCQGFVFALFQSITAYKIDSEHTTDYTKLFLVCKVEILQVTVNKVDALSSF